VSALCQVPDVCPGWLLYGLCSGRRCGCRPCSGFRCVGPVSGLFRFRRISKISQILLNGSLSLSAGLLAVLTGFRNVGCVLSVAVVGVAVGCICGR
jgi:hypothetical protein